MAPCRRNCPTPRCRAAATPCSPVALRLDRPMLAAVRAALRLRGRAVARSERCRTPTGAKCVSWPITETSSVAATPPLAIARASADVAWSLAAFAVGSCGKTDRSWPTGDPGARRHRSSLGLARTPHRTKVMRRRCKSCRAGKGRQPAAGPPPDRRHPPRARSRPPAEPRAATRCRRSPRPVRAPFGTWPLPKPTDALRSKLRAGSARGRQPPPSW